MNDVVEAGYARDRQRLLAVIPFAQDRCGEEVHALRQSSLGNFRTEELAKALDDLTQSLGDLQQGVGNPDPTAPAAKAAMQDAVERARLGRERMERLGDELTAP